MSILEIWRKVAATRYVRGLEADVARLRAENRALLNSILGIAGVPPIPVQAASEGDVCEVQFARGGREAGSKAGAARNTSNGAQVAAPLRRRSWQQINRMLEFESAKKEKPGRAVVAEDADGE